MSSTRRQSYTTERCTPCRECGYPISERHHIQRVNEHGESESTVQLCANCHELYHLVELAEAGSKRCQAILGHNPVFVALGERQLNFAKIVRQIRTQEEQQWICIQRLVEGERDIAARY